MEILLIYIVNLIYSPTFYLYGQLCVWPEIRLCAVTFDFEVTFKTSVVQYYHERFKN